MLLIADGGSTKADWALIAGDGSVETLSGEGFNPNQHDAGQIAARLSGDSRLTSFADRVTEVRYYGSGCSSPELQAIAEHGLRRIFPQAHIVVDHDVQAAALAVCGDRAGIACILGTGSNACYFDGKRAHAARSGLGYVLGDEGSGTWFGKRLVTRYLYGLMPKDLENDFSESYRLTREEAIRRVYREPGANNWLASFAPFLAHHRDHPWVGATLRAGFTEFFELCVEPIRQEKQLPVHFVGSIAHAFRDALRESGAMHGIEVGTILQRPIEGLILHFGRQHR
jgi:N-acetylglucosamine kinase-like BadF-type ATPase